VFPICHLRAVGGCIGSHHGSPLFSIYIYIVPSMVPQRHVRLLLANLFIAREWLYLIQHINCYFYVNINNHLKNSKECGGETYLRHLRRCQSGTITVSIIISCCIHPFTFVFSMRFLDKHEDKFTISFTHDLLHLSLFMGE
jgi:hypothetical protein